MYRCMEKFERRVTRCTRTRGRLRTQKGRRILTRSTTSSRMSLRKGELWGAIYSAWQHLRFWEMGERERRYGGRKGRWGVVVGLWREWGSGDVGAGSCTRKSAGDWRRYWQAGPACRCEKKKGGERECVAVGLPPLRWSAGPIGLLTLFFSSNLFFFSFYVILIWKLFSNSSLIQTF
jgi:hypothetical protein